MNESMKTAYLWTRRRLRRVLSACGIHNGALVASLRRLEQRLTLSRFIAVKNSGVISYNGLKLRYRYEDIDLVGHIQRTGKYEHETTRTIESLLDPGMTFVDAGAHIGYYTMLAAKLVGPEGHVYSFEPVPGTNAMLRENVELNGFSSRATIESYAITDHRTTLGFIIDEGSSVSARMVDPSETGVPLEGTSLDEYFGSCAWPTVHLVKMDIEGAELAGFRGMRELVERNTAIAVIFEVHFQVLSRQGVTMSQLFDELLQMGFARFSILRPDGVKRVGVFRQGIVEIRIPDDVASIAQLPINTVFNVLAQKL
jgi:FkbM family methyltransferase